VNDDVFVEKQQKKAYQVEYNVLGSLHLKSKQDKEVSQVSLILGKMISTRSLFFFPLNLHKF
jgi:ariadne-1